MNEILLFNKGKVLYALIETNKGIGPDLIKMAHKFGDDYYVPITLEQDLYLVKKSLSQIQLKNCACTVLFPREKWKGTSLNHAYTHISQMFMPDFIAHTGNAFIKIYYPIPRQGDLFSADNLNPTLMPLKELRNQKVREYESTMMFKKAMMMALDFHGDQKRKGGSIPYISHLLAVASLVMEHGGNNDEVIAAMLHDAVEDPAGEAALSKIRTKFSKNVVDIVLACTDTMETPKPDWKPRKEAFLVKLDSVPLSACRVIAADKLHNARCILSDFRQNGDAVWERFSGKKDGTLWYYRSIVEILRKKGPPLLVAELGRVVCEIEKLAATPRPGTSNRIDTIKAESNYRILQAMTGMNELKEVVEKDIGIALYNQQLRQVGHDDPPPVPIHMVFMGNPGTGKTKVARLLGSIYKNLGLLSQGHVHEVSRADLVGDVIGATEVRTREAIEKAKGGFLFIDEAYALSKPSMRDYGIEAIEVLLKAMSDVTQDFGVIVAGYPEPMKVFLETNAGLRSRFRNREIHFPDFTPNQMLEIANSYVKKMALQITKEAEEYLENQFRDAYRGRGGSFGNARYVNSIIHDAKATLAERLNSLQRKPTYEELTTITLTDVQRVFEKKIMKAVDLPIDESALNEALSQLHRLVGIPTVKTEVMDLVDLVRYRRSLGKDHRNFLSSHFVFTGNPGTGKTTVARVLAQIFRAVGLLERGHLVECDRQALVAGYIGQTAIKTDAMIEKAHGGVLFIDEAYSLTSDSDRDFGHEAIATLLKRMEDQRGKFIVIVAGYPREMEQFLASNPGLKSRFDTFIHFDDYDSGELFAIANGLFADESVVPDDNSTTFMRSYFEQYVRARDHLSGNARDVRKLVEKSIRNQNLRLARLDTELNILAEEQHWMRQEDLTNWKLPAPQRRQIGFTTD